VFVSNKTKEHKQDHLHIPEGGGP